jgi:hypothetical protein
MACASGPNGQRSMWSLCEQCGAISIIDKDWLFQKTQLLKFRYPRASAHADIICYLFLSFFIADFPLRGWFWSTYSTIRFRQHVDVDPPRLWQHRILSLRPRHHHRQSRFHQHKVHMLRFRPPRLLALSWLVYYNAMYHKDMGNKLPTNCLILSFINHLDSRKAPGIVLWVDCELSYRQVNKNGADSYSIIYVGSARSIFAATTIHNMGGICGYLTFIDVASTSYHEA